MTSFAAKPTLVGDRVLLRPLVGADAEAMARILSDPQVQLLTGSVETTAEAQEPCPLDDRLLAWYASRADQDDRLDLAVIDRASGALVGEVVLNEWDRDGHTANLRILLGPDGRDRGLGSEAVRLLTAYALDALGLSSVTLGVYAHNPRARRVYDRLGYRVVGVDAGEHRLDGEPLDLVLMAVTAQTLQR